MLGLGGAGGQRLGDAVLIAVPLLAIYFFGFSRARGVSGWVGLATFGWIAMMEIAFGPPSGPQVLRLRPGVYRYTSLAAITWIGFVALVLFAAHDLAHRLSKRREDARVPTWLHVATACVALVVAIPLLAGSLTAGRAHADDMVALNSRQELGEIALRMGLSDNAAFVVAGSSLRAATPSNITTLLRENGHYPFADGWDLDCGLSGKRLAVRGGIAWDVDRRGHRLDAAPAGASRERPDHR